MKFIDKIKSWFKKEEIQEFQEEVKQEVQEAVEEPKEGDPICHLCNLPITSSQKLKTLDGKKFHIKPCFRQIMKQGRKEAFG